MHSNIFTKGNSSTGVFGIDLGTTNSVVTAKVSESLPKVLNSESGATTPSCVMFNEDGTITIGKEAYAHRAEPNVVYSFKRHMGSGTKVYKDYTARDIAAIFIDQLLKEVKKLNPEYANFNKVEVSVPAYFNINQREDTKLAIEKYGYEVVGIADEPTAAAIVYQQAKRVKEDFLIFDLGGGTFDAVLIRNIPGVPADTKNLYKELGIDLPDSKAMLEIVDISGDNSLGGDDIDRIAAELYLKDIGMPKLIKDEATMRFLTLHAERVKKTGTPLTPNHPTFKDYKFPIKHVNDAVKEVVQRCYKVMDGMLARANQTKLVCVLCGGSTKSPILREELAKRFILSHDIDPDLAVGVGNSIKYHLDHTDSGTSIVNRLAKGVGIFTDGRVRYLVEKGAVIPLKSKFVARNAKPFDTAVNIELYQGDRLLDAPTHISTIKLDNITSHDEEGYAQIVLELIINSEGIIKMVVTSGDASVESELALSDLGAKQEDKLEIHPDAKFYTRFKKADEHYKSGELTGLVEEYRQTGDREVAKNIMVLMNRLADEKNAK